MTDEELAEEFASNGYALGCTKSSFEIAKKSFLAGLKVGRETKWHDLKKDPNDLPDIHCLNWVIALYDNGTLWCRAKREKCVDGIFWVDSYHYQIYNVIAWKEIELPKEIKEND